MRVEVKICGINSEAARDAAVAAGADYLGFVFYPPSPRAIAPERFAELVAEVPASVRVVAVFVRPSEEEVRAVVEAGRVDLVQLHGEGGLAAVRRAFGGPVIRACPVAERADVQAALALAGEADYLLFDAKPPPDARLPGGNALAFDWRLLGDLPDTLRWFLAGGLRADNVARAVAICGARRVDVSSGVEERPGVKDPARIRAFVRAARGLEVDGGGLGA